MTDLARRRSGHYSTVAIVLHWLIAAAIVTQLVLAWRMGGPKTPESFALIQLHKSVGITILALSLVRLGWRLANPPPPLPATLARWERILAQVTHVGLYVAMIGMPLTGWLAVSASRVEVPTLLYGIIPWPHVPGVPHLAEPAKSLARNIGGGGHEALAILLLALLALHIAGALKHQLLSRDEPVLARMAPGAKAGRWLEPRLLLIVAGLAGVATLALFARPPAQPSTPVASTNPAPQARTLPVFIEGATNTPDPPSEPVHWIVAPDSSLGFVASWGGQQIHGHFDRWRSDILFSPGGLARSRATIVVDLASASTGDKQRDAALPSADWFNVAASPTATFTTDRFEKLTDGHYLAHGTLTLRGVTRPVDLSFGVNFTGDRANVGGIASVNRTEFGVGQGDWKKTDQIPDRVVVTVQLTAKKG
jgi:cytochrome b561/polyisoprenoid-binding protein YceI